MGRYRVGKIAKLRNVCRRSNVDSLSVVVKRRVCRRKGWGQTPIHRRIDEFSQLSKRDLAQVMKAKACLLHGIANGHSLEVTTVVNFASLAIE